VFEYAGRNLFRRGVCFFLRRGFFRCRLFGRSFLGGGFLGGRLFSCRFFHGRGGGFFRGGLGVYFFLFFLFDALQRLGAGFAFVRVVAVLP